MAPRKRKGRDYVLKRMLVIDEDELASTPGPVFFCLFVVFCFYFIFLFFLSCGGAKQGQGPSAHALAITNTLGNRILL